MDNALDIALKKFLRKVNIGTIGEDPTDLDNKKMMQEMEGGVVRNVDRQKYEKLLDENDENNDSLETELPEKTISEEDDSGGDNDEEMLEELENKKPKENIRSLFDLATRGNDIFDKASNKIKESYKPDYVSISVEEKPKRDVDSILNSIMRKRK